MRKSMSVRATVIALACVMSFSAHAIADVVRKIAIPAGDLRQALLTLSKQYGAELVYRPEDVTGFKTHGLTGTYTAQDAVRILLKGTPLDLRVDSSGAMAIVPTRTNKAPSNSAQPSSAAQNVQGREDDASDTFRLAQAAPGQAASASSVERQQASTAVNMSDNRGELQEVLITAERRKGTVLTTPISVTAISGTEIQERGLVDLFDLAQSVAGMSMRTSGPAQTQFVVRGIASSGGNSPTVGFYLDDVPITAPANATNGQVVIDPNLYDLNRIEVLRGPQGTLYGAGSMGGTIKVVTNAPDPAAFDASAQGIVSNTDGGGLNYGANGMLNIPFGNTLALRIVGTGSHTSGWIDRLVIADGEFPLPTNGNTVRGNVLAAPVAKDYTDVNDTNSISVRGSLLWTPNDRFMISLSYFYEQIFQGGPNYIDSDPGTNAHYQPFDTSEPFSDYFNLGNLNFTYKFNGFDLSSVTSRWTRNSTIHQDGAEEWTWGLGFPSYYTSQGGLGPFEPTPWEEDQTKQISEEVHLTSTGSSAFQWLFGYFYSDFTSTLNSFAFAPGAVPFFGTSNIFSLVAPTTTIQNSFFTDLSYQLTPQLKATAGVRRYSYTSQVETNTSGAVAPPGGPFHADESHQGLSPKFGLSYQPSADMLIYASAAKAFRPGGGQGIPVPTSGSAIGDLCEASLQSVYNTTNFVPAPLTYGPDTIWTYEIGEKLRTLDNRLSVNAAAYFSAWTDIQQLVPLSCSFGFTANAGDAHVYGGELEIQAQLGKGFTLSLNGGYTHASLVSSTVHGVGLDPGTPVQQVPEWTTSQSLAYEHGISGQASFMARIDNNYVGSRTDATFAINHVPSYDLTDVRAGVKGSNWTATLFATNVFNKRALLNNAFMVSINLPTYNRIVVSQPLTVGIDLTYHFGR
jgi:iron complex outermembrane receptor protein